MNQLVKNLKMNISMKKSRILGMLVVSAFSLDGCSSAPPEPELVKPDMVRGGRVFYAHCASCHQSPDSESPQLDEADDWDLRPLAWTSMMKDHVKSGFLNMPPKHGNSPLTEQSLNDVLYFMSLKVNAFQ
jgi:cytochrome c5